MAITYSQAVILFITRKGYERLKSIKEFNELISGRRSPSLEELQNDGVARPIRRITTVVLTTYKRNWLTSTMLVVISVKRAQARRYESYVRYWAQDSPDSWHRCISLKW